MAGISLGSNSAPYHVRDQQPNIDYTATTTSTGQTVSDPMVGISGGQTELPEDFTSLHERYEQQKRSFFEHFQNLERGIVDHEGITTCIEQVSRCCQEMEKIVSILQQREEKTAEAMAIIDEFAAIQLQLKEMEGNKIAVVPIAYTTVKARGDNLKLITQDIGAHNVVAALRPYLDTTDVITVEQLEQKETHDLEQIFSTVHKRSSALCHQMHASKENSSIYSQNLRGAEQCIETLKNIIQVLERRDGHHSHSLALKRTQLEELAGQIKEKHSLIPLGPSVLMREDMFKIEQLSTISQSRNYSSEVGEFQEPQVSRMNLLSWIEQYKKEGGYDKISCGFKVHKLNNADMETMFTYLALIKTKEQQKCEKQGLLEGVELADAQQMLTAPPQVPYRPSPIVDNPQTYALSITGSSEASMVDQQKSHMGVVISDFLKGFLPFAYSETNMAERKQLQLTLLERLRIEGLQKLDEWNFEKMEIYSSNDYRTIKGLSALFSDSDKVFQADYVLLFHKRA